MTEYHVPAFTPSGDLTRIPQANDNVPAELRPLAAAIGKFGSVNDNLRRLVAFTGAAGAGKSTATRHLVERYGYTLVKFAGPLKDMMRAIGLTEDEIEGGMKEAPSSTLLGKTPRHGMQTLGTEWGRNCIGEDLWISLWRRRVEAVFASGGRVVVDDCRFPNEADVIRKFGGSIYLLAGRGGIAGNHASEQGCRDMDVIIFNQGSVEDLHDMVDRRIKLAA